MVRDWSQQLTHEAGEREATDRKETQTNETDYLGYLFQGEEINKHEK